MKAEDKAKELVDKMQWSVWSIADELLADIQAKQCALICVNEILDSYEPHSTHDYWVQVKEHIKQM
jgi:hypothetical protein